MTWRDTLRPKSVLLDAALIAGVLLALNLSIDRAHAGWINLNPSPYLLVPVLLGGRYGFTVGVLSGLLASALVATLQIVGGAPSLRAALASAAYTHVSFVFAGGICGELFGWFRRDRAQTTAQLEKLQTSARKLDADVRYLRGVKDELDRVVAARDGEMSALDTELRRLYASNERDLPSEVLQFLKRQVRLSDGAIYTTAAADGPLKRMALVGRDTHLPESFDPRTSTVVRLALSRASLVTLPEILQRREPGADEPILIAAPLRDSEGRVRALLIVAGLPFIAFTPHTANLVSMICDWAGEALDLASGAEGRYRVIGGREAQRIFTRAHFQHLLLLALQANQRHRLPSSVVIFSLPGANTSNQPRFEQALVTSVRAGDYAAELDRSEPHLAVLLPLVGERGATIFIERSKQFLKRSGPWPSEVQVRRVELGRTDDFAELMAEIDAKA